MNVIHKAWRWYFWASAIVVAFGAFNFTLKEGFTDWSSFGYLLYMILDSIVQILSLVCLYGFAWQARFGKQQYWVVFFFVNVVLFFTTISYSIIVVMFFPPKDAYAVLSQYPELIEGVRPLYFGMMVLAVALKLPMFVANYRYAFRNKHLWATPP